MWKWTQKHQQTFEQLKAILTSASMLTHFDETKLTKLETNASDDIISGALLQFTNQNKWHPMAFFLKTINLA
jgi:hypothetical protein